MQLKLHEELRAAQDVALKLAEQNAALRAERGRLRAGFACQEDDRGYLIKKNLLLSKENDGRKAQLEGLRGQVEQLLCERDALRERVQEQRQQARCPSEQMRCMLLSNRS